MAQNGKHVAKSMAEKESRKVATRGCINSHPSTIERQEMLADAQRSLLHASGLGDVPSLSAALDAGAQINLLDDSGYNALHRAGAGGHAAAVARLLDRKANVALCDAQGGCTALHGRGRHGLGRRADHDAAQDPRGRDPAERPPARAR